MTDYENEVDQVLAKKKSSLEGLELPDLEVDFIRDVEDVEEGKIQEFFNWLGDYLSALSEKALRYFEGFFGSAPKFSSPSFEFDYKLILIVLLVVLFLGILGLVIYRFLPSNYQADNESSDSEEKLTDLQNSSFVYRARVEWKNFVEKYYGDHSLTPKEVYLREKFDSKSAVDQDILYKIMFFYDSNAVHDLEEFRKQLHALAQRIKGKYES